MSARKWIVIGAGLAIVAYGIVTQSGKSPQDGAETAAQDTAQNAPPSQPPLQITTPADAEVRGVDLSHYQGDVDFSKFAGDGLAFVYAKASEGERTKDAEYANNKTGAMAAGLSFGSYHFYETSEGPGAQAAHFLSQIGDVSGQLPPVVDVETPPKGSVTDLAADVQSFVAQVQKATGCQPIVYSNKSIWDTYLKFDTSTYPLWLAEYSNTINLPNTAASWVFWQHSQSGSDAGVSGAVDTDVFNGRAGDLAALKCP